MQEQLNSLKAKRKELEETIVNSVSTMKKAKKELAGIDKAIRALENIDFDSDDTVNE